MFGLCQFFLSLKLLKNYAPLFDNEWLNFLAKKRFSSKIEIIEVKIMLTELEEVIVTEEKEMPSLNHSVICLRIIRQLLENPTIEPLPELTLDIDKGITPDISVYKSAQIKPNFRRDITRYSEMPILAIEVISASQNIQDLLIKADLLVGNGVKAVWTIEPFTNTIFVTTKDSEEKFTNQEIESEGIKVDFKKIFG